MLLKNREKNEVLEGYKLWKIKREVKTLFISRFI